MPWSFTPPRATSPRPCRDGCCCLQARVGPRLPAQSAFRGCITLAHSLARLHIAGYVAATVARLATGWAGSPFAGRGSHPLDDYTEFRRFIANLLLSDQSFLVALDALPLNIVLGQGWRVAAAHLREGLSPLVLVTLAQEAGTERHVRVDVDKRMVVDDPPTAISVAALDEIVKQVGKRRREVLLASSF